MVILSQGFRAGKFSEFLQVSFWENGEGQRVGDSAPRKYIGGRKNRSLGAISLRGAVWALGGRPQPRTQLTFPPLPKAQLTFPPLPKKLPSVRSGWKENRNKTISMVEFGL